jgi:hypothetical protein
MNEQDLARISSPSAATPENPGIQRLEVVSRAPSRAVRPVTNLAKVFGQFAEVQHQVTEQVLALEESVGQEREMLAATVAQLPDLKERINWLISSFYELGQKDAALDQRLNQQDVRAGELEERDIALEQRIDRQDVQLATVAANVQALLDGQRRWDSTMDQLIEVLLRARGACPPMAQLAEGKDTAPKLQATSA